MHDLRNFVLLVSLEMAVGKNLTGALKGKWYI